MLRSVFLAATALAVAGCVPNPADIETTPVPVKTADGTVLCQLYYPDIVMWDRAIDVPQGMTRQAADDVCKAAGERQRADGYQ